MEDFHLSGCIASLTVTGKLLALCKNKMFVTTIPHSVVTTIPNIGYESNKQKCVLSAISWTKQKQQKLDGSCKHPLMASRSSLLKLSSYPITSGVIEIKQTSADCNHFRKTTSLMI